MTGFRNRSPIRLIPVVPIIALAAFVVAGCQALDDQSAAARPSVVSLQTPVPGGGQASSGRPAGGSGSDAGRPRLRMDMTEEESFHLWEMWRVCLHQNGVKELTARKKAAAAAGEQVTHLLLDQSGESKSAYVACAGKVPLNPPEMDKDKNPNYASQYNDYIQCLRRHRIFVHALPDGDGWQADSGAQQTVGDGQLWNIDRACETASFHVG